MRLFLSEISARRGMPGDVCTTHIVATGGARRARAVGRGWCPLGSYICGARVLVVWCACGAREGGDRPFLPARPFGASQGPRPGAADATTRNPTHRASGP